MPIEQLMAMYGCGERGGGTAPLTSPTVTPGAGGDVSSSAPLTSSDLPHQSVGSNGNSYRMETATSGGDDWEVGGPDVHAVPSQTVRLLRCKTISLECH